MVNNRIPLWKQPLVILRTIITIGTILIVCDLAAQYFCEPKITAQKINFFIFTALYRTYLVCIKDRLATSLTIANLSKNLLNFRRAFLS